MVGEEKRLKILCLHGYRQSGDIFKQKLGGLRKALKKHAELFFVTAPNKLLQVEQISESDPQINEKEQYAWWFSTRDLTFDSKVPSDMSLGYENSLDLIEKTFKEYGPFDGLLGFSQGAAFVGIICDIHKSLNIHFSFAIMVAGFKSLCSTHLNNYCKVSSIPSLHVYGETDQIIIKERSEYMLQRFQDPQVIIHPGGHYVPASSAVKQGYVLFLEEIKKTLLF